MTIIKWACTECKGIFISDSTEHHTPNYCNCKDPSIRCGIDAEVDLMRLIGNPVILSEE